MDTRKIIYIAFAFALQSCGGGSDEGILSAPGNLQSTDEPTDGLVNSDSESMNPLVDGSIYYGGTSSASYTYLMDLRTGENTLYPNSDYWEEYYEGSEFIYSQPVRDGEGGAVLTILSCGSGIYNVHTTCIVVVDNLGRALHSFSLEYDVYGSAKLSRDGQYVALVLDDSDQKQFLEIYTVDGKLVSSRKIDDNYPFHWLTDGRLLVEEFKKFVKTKPYSSVPDIDITFNDNQESWIGSSDVAPNGNQVAYISTRSTAEGIRTELKILDLATLKIKGVLRTPNADVGNRLAHPSWSPDGKWILVNLGTRYAGAVGTPLGKIPNSYYAVLADHPGWLTVDSYIEDASSPRGPSVIRLKNSIGGVSHSYFWGRSKEYHWVPAPPQI